MTLRVGFCGLGQMGLPIAGHLIDAGHGLTVWNRHPERAEALRARGASVAATPSAAADGADVVLTSLATGDAVREVVLGPDGVAQTLSSDAALIEMSTIGPDAVTGWLRAGLSDDRHLIDAPILGSVPQIVERRVQILLGADDEQAARWAPVLETFGKVHHVGPPGAGAAMKLVANSTLIALLATLGEALAIAEFEKLDRATVLDVLAASAMGPTLQAKRRMIETGEFAPDCKLALGLKDADLVAAAAEVACADLPVATAARNWMSRAQAAGRGAEDVAAVIEVIAANAAQRPPDPEATSQASRFSTNR